MLLTPEIRSSNPITFKKIIIALSLKSEKLSKRGPFNEANIEVVASSLTEQLFVSYVPIYLNFILSAPLHHAVWQTQQ